MQEIYSQHRNFVLSKNHKVQCFFLIGREAGGEAEMGFQTPGKAAKRHRSRVPRGLCPLNHRQETRHVCPFQPRSKGKDAQNRLS